MSCAPRNEEGCQPAVAKATCLLIHRIRSLHSRVVKELAEDLRMAKQLMLGKYLKRKKG